MNRTHDRPVKSENPIALSTSSSSVEPTKPNPFRSRSPTSVPIMPPGASGSGVVRLCRRRCSIAALAQISSTKPTPATTTERRSTNEAVSSLP